MLSRFETLLLSMIIVSGILGTVYVLKALPSQAEIRQFIKNN